jgi:hypothetical protein
LVLTGAQAEGATILEGIAMETAAVETESTEPTVGAMTMTAPESETSVAPEVSTEEQAYLHPEACTNVVVRMVMIEEVAPLRSAPMPET